MMQGEADILPENKLPVVADVASGRQGLFRLRPKIWTVACRQPKVPDLIRPEAAAPTECRVVEPNRCDAPRFRPRRERRVFHFGRIIKSAKSSRDRNTACVTRPPNNRIEFIFCVVESAYEIPRRNRRGFVANGSDVFVNQRRIDEWILP